MAESEIEADTRPSQDEIDIMRVTIKTQKEWVDGCHRELKAKDAEIVHLRDINADQDHALDQARREIERLQTAYAHDMALAAAEGQADHQAAQRLRYELDSVGPAVALLNSHVERLQAYADAHPCDHMPACVDTRRDTLEAAGEPGPCEARIWHGPGHQSSTRCRLRGQHEEHEAVYGEFSQFATWRDQPDGKLTFSGYFDEAPHA